MKKNGRQVSSRNTRELHFLTQRHLPTGADIGVPAKNRLMPWLDEIEENPLPPQTKVLSPFGEHRYYDTTPKQACDQMVEPDDSVSHHSSNASTNVSSISSARAKAIAKKNALLARAQFLDKVQELESRSLEAEKRRNIEREFDKLQLSQQLEKIKLKADIAAAEAENALADIDNAEINGHHATINVPVPAETKPLNPLASEWVQTLARPSNFVSNQEILGSPSAMSGTGSENGQSKLSDQGSSVSAGSVGFLQQQQRELIETLRLPTSQLMSFSGDPLQYWMFMQSFDHMVGNTSVSHAAKLNRLLQCCTGKAFKVIECCAMMDPVTGYAKARSLLKQRFGNDFRISESWIQKIVDGPAIKRMMALHYRILLMMSEAARKHWKPWDG